MDPIETLLAQEEIRTLRARYFRYVDTKQWDAWGRLFVDNCTFVDLAGDFRCRGREDLLTAVAEALEGVVSVHHGHTPEITILDLVSAKGIWSMADYLVYPPNKNFQSQESSTRVHGYGHYVDSYVKVDGVWLFEQVTVSRIYLEHHGTMTAVHPRILQP